MLNRLKDVLYLEKWEGYFFYPVEDENYDDPIRVYFNIDVEIKNDSFVGTHSDEESAPLFDKNGTIKGFFEDYLISFTLKYPYYYGYDDTGNLITDKNKNHPEIHYYGNFIKETNSYIGNWEMFEDFEDPIEGKIVESIDGLWEFKVISSKVK